VATSTSAALFLILELTNGPPGTQVVGRTAGSGAFNPPPVEPLRTFLVAAAAVDSVTSRGTHASTPPDLCAKSAFLLTPRRERRTLPSGPEKRLLREETQVAAGASSSSHQASPAHVAIAAAAPLGGVALAYLLWWISDRLLYIGPLDRAKFGWVVVVPVWALTPVVAAYVWRSLNSRQTAVVAGTVGLVVALFAMVLFWLAIAFLDCQFGAVRSPAESVLPSVIVGVVIGGGFAAACLGAVAVLRRGRWWSALLVGVASAVAFLFLAVLVAAPFIMGGGCLRPPLS